jgi:RHS repeat-associated protein
MKATPDSQTLYLGSYEIKDGVPAVYVMLGSRRLARLDFTNAGAIQKTRYYHQDRLGSTSLVTDEQGESVESADYAPFGELRPGRAITASHTFTDQTYDTETGLFYYNSRYYDPAIGRFIMADTVIPNPAVPQSLNPYSYCLNDPLNHWK